MGFGRIELAERLITAVASLAGRALGLGVITGVRRRVAGSVGPGDRAMSSNGTDSCINESVYRPQTDTICQSVVGMLGTVQRHWT